MTRPTLAPRYFALLAACAVSTSLVGNASPPAATPAGVDAHVEHPAQLGEAAGWQQDTSSVSFGVFPYLQPVELEQLMSGITRYLASRLGSPVHFMTNTSFERFRARLEQGVFDVALVQPFDYVALSEQSHYTPVARLEAPLTAIFVTVDDAPITELSDLAGKSVAFPPSGAAVSHLGKMALREAGLTPGVDVTPVHRSDHRSCLHHLLVGTVSACVTNRIPFDVFMEGFAAPFRIFRETVAIPHILFVVRADLPTLRRERIGRVIEEMSADRVGREALREAGLPGLVRAVDSDYDVVREIQRALRSGG